MIERDKGPRDDRWYLRLMAPNTKGDKFAWLDPTSIYINDTAFHDLLDDITADLTEVPCDVVGGLDAMGFVLGAALAARLGVGFLPIRKAGKLCVDTDCVSFTNYSGRTQDMEMRTSGLCRGDPRPAGRSVDRDRRHDGGRDSSLVENVRPASSPGSSRIAVEESPGAAKLRARLSRSSAPSCPDRAGRQECNAQHLSSFEFLPARARFPTRCGGPTIGIEPFTLSCTAGGRRRSKGSVTSCRRGSP